MVLTGMSVMLKYRNSLLSSVFESFPPIERHTKAKTSSSFSTLPYTPTSRSISTASPVSSSTSRMTASVGSSPLSTPPPGRFHTSQSCRRHRRTLARSSKITANEPRLYIFELPETVVIWAERVGGRFCATPSSAPYRFPEDVQASCAWPWQCTLISVIK